MHFRSQSFCHQAWNVKGQNIWKKLQLFSQAMRVRLSQRVSFRLSKSILKCLKSVFLINTCRGEISTQKCEIELPLPQFYWIPNCTNQVPQESVSYKHTCTYVYNTFLYNKALKLQCSTFFLNPFTLLYYNVNIFCTNKLLWSMWMVPIPNETK